MFYTSKAALPILLNIRPDAGASRKLIVSKLERGSSSGIMNLSKIHNYLSITLSYILWTITFWTDGNTVAIHAVNNVGFMEFQPLSFLFNLSKTFSRLKNTHMVILCTLSSVVMVWSPLRNQKCFVNVGERSKPWLNNYKHYWLLVEDRLWAALTCVTVRYLADQPQLNLFPCRFCTTNNVKLLLFSCRQTDSSHYSCGCERCLTGKCKQKDDVSVWADDKCWSFTLSWGHCWRKEENLLFLHTTDMLHLYASYISYQGF